MGVRRRPGTHLFTFGSAIHKPALTRESGQSPAGYITSCTTSLRRRNCGVKGGLNRAYLGGPAATNPARPIAACSRAR